MNKLNFVVITLLLVMLLAFPLGPVRAQGIPEPPVPAASIESSFVDAAVNGVPLALLVFGLVAFLKLQGLTGRGLLYASLISGLFLGIGYMVYKTRPPSGDWWIVYGYWFGVAVYGLGLGLLASGVYEGARSAVTSALARVGLVKQTGDQG